MKGHKGKARIKEPVSQLEEVFDALCQEQVLSIKRDAKQKTAQGEVYFLELEKKKEWVRLLYADRVATADFYDCASQRDLSAQGDSNRDARKYLNYTVLSAYREGQRAFLQVQDSDLAKRLSLGLAEGKPQTHRRVFRVDLDDFSEVAKFLRIHIENY